MFGYDFWEAEEDEFLMYLEGLKALEEEEED